MILTTALASRIGSWISIRITDTHAGVYQGEEEEEWKQVAEWITIIHRCLIPTHAQLLEDR